MPTDTRRISGPEKSKSPYDFCTGAAPVDLGQLFSERPDGRKASQLRPLFLRAGVISQARGSAYIEMNETKAICAVYGPREVQRREDFSLQGQLTCEMKMATFSGRHRLSHQQDNQERDLSLQILEALQPAVCLHKYPKAQINIYVTLLQHDGSALTAAILCASLALASAGVEMYDLVLASSVAMHNNQTLTDPTIQEEKAILGTAATGHSGVLTVAFMPSLHQVSAITCDGEVQFETLNSTMQECIGNCQKLYSVMQQTLTSHIQEKRKDSTNKT